MGNIEEKEKDNQNLLSYQKDNNQVLFRFFGIEMTAPKGLKYPRIVYVSFIVVNFFLLLVLRKLIIN